MGLTAAAVVLAWQVNKPAVLAFSSFAGLNDDPQPIFALGDSFAESPHFQDQFSREFPGRSVTIDGAGSSSLLEQGQGYNKRMSGPQVAFGRP